MPDGFEVDLKAIRKHAGDISTLMDNVRGAEDAARTPIDPHTFGIIGTTWSWALNLWTEDAAGFVRAAADCGDEVSKTLLDMANGYADNQQKDVDTYAQQTDILEDLDHTGPVIRPGEGS